MGAGLEAATAIITYTRANQTREPENERKCAQMPFTHHHYFDGSNICSCVSNSVVERPFWEEIRYCCKFMVPAGLGVFHVMYTKHADELRSVIYLY